MQNLPSIPKSHPTRLDPRLEKLIFRLRDASGFGPKRLYYLLRRNLQIEIIASSIPTLSNRYMVSLIFGMPYT